MVRPLYRSAAYRTEPRHGPTEPPPTTAHPIGLTQPCRTLDFVSRQVLDQFTKAGSPSERAAAAALADTAVKELLGTSPQAGDTIGRFVTPVLYLVPPPCFFFFFCVGLSLSACLPPPRLLFSGGYT